MTAKQSKRARREAARRACNASAPELRAAYDTYQDRGFEILSVSVQEGDAEVAAFIDRHNLGYQFLLDRTGEIASTYAVATTPTTYFIAPMASSPTAPPASSRKAGLRRTSSALRPADELRMTTRCTGKTATKENNP